MYTAIPKSQFKRFISSVPNLPLKLRVDCLSSSIWAFTPPSRRVLSSTLLDESFKSVREDVQQVFRSSPQLGIVADESTNITGDRIENVSVMCEGTSYHWANTYCADRDADAETAVESIREQAVEITNGDLDKISTLSTDTCPTQQKG